MTTITKGDDTFGIRFLYGTTQNPNQYNPLTAGDYTNVLYSEVAALVSMTINGGSNLGDKYLDLSFIQSFIMLSTFSAASTPWRCAIVANSANLATSTPSGTGAAWPIFELILE